MKKQINKYLFVLFALIIISITAIGSASASEDIHGFDLRNGFSLGTGLSVAKGIFDAQLLASFNASL